jgi:hypothetical protein
MFVALCLKKTAIIFLQNIDQLDSLIEKHTYTVFSARLENNCLYNTHVYVIYPMFCLARLGTGISTRGTGLKLGLVSLGLLVYEVVTHISLSPVRVIPPVLQTHFISLSLML